MASHIISVRYKDRNARVAPRASLEIIPVHAVLGLDVADDGLDSRATLHLATDGSRNAADLPRDPDPEPMRVVVAAIPFVDVDTASLHAGGLLHLGDPRPSVCPRRDA